jgi:hypothetical protein
VNTVKITTTLQSNIIHLTNVDKFIGHKVEITINEVKSNSKKKWKSLASVNLKKSIDTKNLRDFAHE